MIDTRQAWGRTAYRHIAEATAKSAPPSKGQRDSLRDRLSYSVTLVMVTMLVTAALCGVFQ